MKAAISVIGAVLLIIAGGVLASILAVWVYSTFVQPGQPLSAYQSFAQESGPIVSIIAGPLVTYGVLRWLLRALPKDVARRRAWVIMAIYLIFDLVVLAANQPQAKVWGFAAASALLRVGAAMLATRRVE